VLSTLAFNFILRHYSLEYVDGPGLTHIAGKERMALYLRNQFEFSRQYLTVSEETCAADTYIGTWTLDMDLGGVLHVETPETRVQSACFLRLRLKYGKLVSSFAVIVNLRRYIWAPGI